jgi:hypothetical protein
MTKEQIESLLERVRSWPREDQEELAELARDITARRSGVFRATEDELNAIDEAQDSGVATATEVKAAFRKFHGT